MPRKFFCYVDESGQDTQGELFIVSVVVADEEVSLLRRLCEAIEEDAGKGRRKWAKTNPLRRRAYIEKVISSSAFEGKLNFAAYRDSLDYTTLTVRTIAEALKARGERDYRATVFIDGLSRSLEQAVGLRLRRLGIPAKKVRGVRKEENDTLIRLADAVCGFVRDAMEGQPEMHALLERGLKNGVLVNLSQK